MRQRIIIDSNNSDGAFDLIDLDTYEVVASTSRSSECGRLLYEALGEYTCAMEFVSVNGWT